MELVERPDFVQAILTDADKVARYASKNYGQYGIEVTGMVTAESDPKMHAKIADLHAKANAFMAPQRMEMPTIFIVKDKIHPLSYESTFNTILITEEAVKTLSQKAVLGCIAHELGEAVYFERKGKNLPAGFATDDKERFADEFGAAIAGTKTMITALKEMEDLTVPKGEAMIKAKAHLGLAPEATEREFFEAVKKTYGHDYIPYGERIEHLKQRQHVCQYAQRVFDESSEGMSRGSKRTTPTPRDGGWADR